MMMLLMLMFEMSSTRIYVRLLKCAHHTLIRFHTNETMLFSPILCDPSATDDDDDADRACAPAVDTCAHMRARKWHAGRLGGWCEKHIGNTVQFYIIFWHGKTCFEAFNAKIVKWSAQFGNRKKSPSSTHTKPTVFCNVVTVTASIAIKAIQIGRKRINSRVFWYSKWVYEFSWVSVSVFAVWVWTGHEYDLQLINCISANRKFEFPGGSEFIEYETKKIERDFNCSNMVIRSKVCVSEICYKNTCIRFFLLYPNWMWL